MKGIKQKFNDMDKVLLFSVIIMVFYGLLNIVTASSREAFSQNVSIYYYFYRHSAMILIGFIGFLTIINIDTKKYDKYALFGYIVIIFILLVLLFSVDDFRGSKNWITIMGIKFQPSEFAKPVLIVSTAILFEKFYKILRTKNNKHYNQIGYIMIVGFLFPAIVFIQKDLGTAIILLGIFGFMFLASPILKQDKFKIILSVFITFIVVSLILVLSGNKILTDEQRDRLYYFNPCSKYEGSGYQICNGMIAINDGGLTGLGLSKSKQKYSYIPEPHTDSVFAIIVEENGFIFSGFILVMYLIIIYRIIKISENSKSIRNRYISFGIAIYIFMHIFINLGGLFAIIPLTGVPLPFLSYGGTFTVTLICSIGIAERIAIENKNEKIKIGDL